MHFLVFYEKQPTVPIKPKKTKKNQKVRVRVPKKPKIIGFQNITQLAELGLAASTPIWLASWLHPH